MSRWLCLQAYSTRPQWRWRCVASGEARGVVVQRTCGKDLCYLFFCVRLCDRGMRCIRSLELYHHRLHRTSGDNRMCSDACVTVRYFVMCPHLNYDSVFHAGRNCSYRRFCRLRMLLRCAVLSTWLAARHTRLTLSHAY